MIPENSDEKVKEKDSGAQQKIEHQTSKKMTPADSRI
jgi:hypothetical protein